MSNLKECPFCGGEAVLLSSSCQHKVACGTQACHAQHGRIFKTKFQAIKAWNTRTKDNAIDEISQAVVNCFGKMPIASDGTLLVGMESYDILVETINKYKTNKG